MVVWTLTRSVWTFRSETETLKLMSFWVVEGGRVGAMFCNVAYESR